MKIRNQIKPEELAKLNKIKLSGPYAAPKGKAKQLIILLHGLGADGNDLFGLVPYMQETLPGAYFIAPDAHMACDMAPYGRQWFSLKIRDEAKILEGLQEADVVLRNFIHEKLAELDLTEANLVLLGFSQGTMLSLYTALRLEKPIAGIVGYSGALVAPYLLKDEITARPKICLVHGEDDMVVPFAAFSEAISVLQKLGLEVNGYSRPGLGHGIDPEGLQIGIKFLYGLWS